MLVPLLQLLLLHRFAIKATSVCYGVTRICVELRKEINASLGADVNAVTLAINLWELLEGLIVSGCGLGTLSSRATG